MAIAPDATVRRLNRNVRQKHARLSFVGESPFGPSLLVRSYRLGNGLDIHLLSDDSAPVVSYQSWFRVGSRHETAGKTGLAHLFEHLMFSETKTLGAGEFDRILEAAGAETNAATWTDWTFYYENLPARELQLAIRLEADRMQNLVLRDPLVASEKEVVANERRSRVDDDVEGTVNELLYSTAFRRHPYRRPTIGSMRDIKGFTTDDCRQFYRSYYAPNNAILAVAGSFEDEAALGLIREHYGTMRAARLPARPAVVEPSQRKERRKVLVQPTSTEKLQIGYRTPGFESPDWLVLTVINEILVGGRSSRLHRLLVEERELASDVRAALSPFRDPGLYDLWVGARAGTRARTLLIHVDRELQRLARHGVTEAELEKAKARLELGFLQGMETASGKAEQIGFYATVVGDVGAAFRRLGQYLRVTREDVHRVAARYFDRSQRTVIEVLPAQGGR